MTKIAEDRAMTPNNQLAEPVAERAAIKPLEWTEPRPPGKDVCYYDHALAETPFGQYRIEWKSWKDYPSFTISGPNEFFGVEDTLDGAKLSAQADFETRILDALASPAAISGDGGVAVTAKMVEAAWNLLNRGGYRIDGSAVHAALTAALATAPEGKARNLRQIVYDALDLSDELRNECADAVVAALTGSSYP